MDYLDKFELALEKVQKAPRYTGGEMNTAVTERKALSYSKVIRGMMLAIIAAEAVGGWAYDN